jgi:hypothetical protein
MHVACVCCVLCKWRSLHRPDYSSRGVLLNGACMNVIVKSPQLGGPDPLGLSGHKKIMLQCILLHVSALFSLVRE